MLGTHVQKQRGHRALWGWGGQNEIVIKQCGGSIAIEVLFRLHGNKRKTKPGGAQGEGKKERTAT